MTWVILRGRIIIYLNWLRRTRGRKLLRPIILGLMGLGLTGLAYFLAVELFHAILALFPEFVPGFIVLIFTGLTIFLLLTGVSAVLVQLYLSSDLNLLMSAPVPLSSIFIAKILESLLVTGLPTLAGLMALIAYGQASSASLLYYPLAVLVLLAFLALMTSVNFLVVIGVMRVVPARRAREAVTVLGTAMGAAIWAFYMLFLNGSNRAAALGQDLASLQPSAQLLSDNLRWAPPGWAAAAVSSFLAGDWNTLALNAGLLVAVSAAMILLAYAAFTRSFSFGWLGAREAPSKALGARHLNGAGHRREAALPLLPRVDGAIVAKDWRVLSRDMRIMSRLIFPLVVVFVLSFGAFSGSSAASLPPDLQFWRVVGLVVVLLPYMFSSSLALSSIAYEGKAFPLLRLAPVPTTSLVRAKFLSWFLPVVIFCEVVVMTAGILEGGSVRQLLALAVVAVWFSAGLVMIAVTAGAVAPRFDAQNPNRPVGLSSTLVWLVASSIFILGSAIAIGWAIVLFLPISIPELAAANPLVVFIISVIAVVGLALALAVLALTVVQGTRLLAKWQMAE